MKRRLNILTFLILLALAVNTGYTFFYSWDEISTDYMDGYTKGEERFQASGKNPDVSKISRRLYLRKNDNGTAILDSVYNEKSGTYVPAAIQRLDVRVPNDNSVSKDMIYVFLTLVLIPAMLGVVILFLKLIASIKVAAIFTRNNVRRLRWIGICLITISALYSVGNYVELEQTRSVVAIDGYEITGENIIEFSSFINALIAFLAAEVFALGLKLREEQELTI